MHDQESMRPIGYNRYIQRKGQYENYILHNYVIAKKRGRIVYFNPHDQLTPTTRRAMAQAALHFGLGEIKVSFAGGMMRITYKGETYIPSMRGIIALKIPAS